jgi:hypothetical protein
MNYKKELNDLKIDEYSKNFGFKNFRQFFPTKEETTSTPPLFFIANDRVFIKVLIRRKEENKPFKDDTALEAKVLKQASNLFKEKITPCIIQYIEDKLIPFDCRSIYPYFPRKYFVDYEFKDYLRVITSEYVVNSIDLRKWSKKNTYSNFIWKSVVFQIIYTIHCIQKELKIVHNDLHDENIFMKNISPTNVKFIVSGKEYYFYGITWVPKISDFEFCSGDDFSNPLNKRHKSLSQNFNKYYDVYVFLNGLICLKNCPQEIRNMVNEFYSRLDGVEYSDTSSSESEFESECSHSECNSDCNSDCKSESEYGSQKSYISSESELSIDRPNRLRANIKYDNFPGPLEILNHSYFSDLLISKPDNNFKYIFTID